MSKQQQTNKNQNKGQANRKDWNKDASPLGLLQQPKLRHCLLESREFPNSPAG